MLFDNKKKKEEEKFLEELAQKEKEEAKAKAEAEAEALKQAAEKEAQKAEKKAEGPMLKTLIGEGITFYGTFQTNDPMEINGTVMGDITSTSEISLTRNAQLHGDASMDSLRSDGLIDGNMTVNQKSQFTSTSSMKGNLITASLVTDPGSNFEGNLSLLKKPSQPLKAVDIRAAEIKEEIKEEIKAEASKIDVESLTQAQKKLEELEAEQKKQSENSEESEEDQKFDEIAAAQKLFEESEEKDVEVSEEDIFGTKK